MLLTFAVVQPAITRAVAAMSQKKLLFMRAIKLPVAQNACEAYRVPNSGEVCSHRRKEVDWVRSAGGPRQQRCVDSAALVNSIAPLSCYALRPGTGRVASKAKNRQLLRPVR